MLKLLGQLSPLREPHEERSATNVRPTKAKLKIFFISKILITHIFNNGLPLKLVQRNKIIRVLESPVSLEFIITHLNSKPTDLSLNYHGKVDFDLSTVTRLIDVYQRAAKKLPSYVSKLCAITKLSYEQASSEVTAHFKANLVQGKSILDLSGGLGVDSFYFSMHCPQVVHIERVEKIQELAQFNFNRLGSKNILSKIHDGNKVTSLLSEHNPQVVYLDPDRRTKDNSRSIMLEDCEPNVLQIKDELLKSTQQILIKLSPMIDLSYLRKSLLEMDKIWVISVKNEVKEVLVQLTNTSPKKTEINAIELNEECCRRFSSEDTYESNTTVNAPTNVLFDPGRSLHKANLVKEYAGRNGLLAIGQEGAFYYASLDQTDLFGRIFNILEQWPVHWKNINKRLKTLKIRQVEVVERNFPETVAQIRKRLRVQEGGTHFLIFTKTADGYGCFLAQRNDA
ncbi:MAG: hypothetical protein ACI8ZN_001278 [Bacteroidia bacterium]|jgi:hypothetical protein